MEQILLVEEASGVLDALVTAPAVPCTGLESRCIRNTKATSNYHIIPG